MPCTRSLAQSHHSQYDSEHLQHLLVHHDQAGGEPQCLVWACRACKRMRRVLDRRAMATVRERKRLSKVRPESGIVDGLNVVIFPKVQSAAAGERSF